MIARVPECVAVPHVNQAFSLDLSPEIRALRDRALELHREARPGIVEITLADACAWRQHSEEEDWLLWRARRCAERLRRLPVELEPGECIVGKPLFRHPRADEGGELEAAQATLASVPPFPGGDAGHFHPDYAKLFALGIGGIRLEIEERMAREGVPEQKRVFYAACGIAIEGLSVFALRVGDACERMSCTDEHHAGQWLELARVCRRVAVSPPETFHEAIQLMFLAQIALWFGEDHGLTTPGRMDQTLRRFYEADVSAGRITPRQAFELICCLYIQMNRILWPGSAVSVIVGGRDEAGCDVTNDLTYLCLAARQATQLVYPTVGLAWHKGTPSELSDFSVRMLATGVGDPAFFNDELIAEGLREHGVSREDSTQYMNSTCVEIKVVGASNMWVTQPYINCPKGLLEVMEQVRSGERPCPSTFEDLCQGVEANLAGRIREAAERLHAVWKQRERTGCFPLASCLVSDCLERGLDFDRGGARYNWVENSFVGLANLVDSLSAVRRLVYGDRELSLSEFAAVLAESYRGHEPLRQRILNALPRYGNDDDEADSLAVRLAGFLIDATESQTVGLHRYVPGFFCWIMHERMGSETGATPDGRCAGLPLADGAGAAQGRENRGPTASVLSTTKWCHRKVLGGLVHNAKFSTSVLRTEGDLAALRGVIETFLRRGGFEIQVNVVGREELLEAKRRPELFPDLLVRVAGYSDYFVHLNEKMQDEVIARTEHEL